MIITLAIVDVLALIYASLRIYHKVHVTDPQYGRDHLLKHHKNTFISGLPEMLDDRRITGRPVSHVR